MRKDRIYELKIDDEDEISGIDSISLVDEPAIEVNWVAFKKDKEHDFHIPDGEDDIYLQRLLAKGQPEEDLLNEGYELYSVSPVNKKDFTTPNQESEEDTDLYRVRYKYTLNSNIKQSAIIPTTRQFCRELINKNYVWRVEDIESELNDFGQSAQFWRGGYNCRHSWVRMMYKKTGDIINKASVNKNKVAPGGFPVELSPEWIQPDLVTGPTAANPKPSTVKNLGLSKSKNQFALPYFNNKEDAERYAVKIGCEGSHEHIVDDRVFYMPCEEHPEDMGYDVGGIGGYVDPGIKKKKKKKMEEDFKYLFEKSYSDYPDSVKNNARAVLKWVDENGWGSCGTPVGKQRANQLANGEPISEETIKRMYSYLSRHEKDLDSSKGYGDGCGKLMYDSWGGKTALSWAESKIKSIEREKMSKQYFQIDSEEKRMVVGPAMIPELKIFRKDAMGNPYYVFFSSETIKMIAEKYMRNKYLDNNDQMHDGQAVQDVYVIESWIKEDENDKSVKYGFQDLPIGTWFVTMKVKNDEIWNKVKNKELNGFSVSGFFEEVEAFSKEEMFLFQLADLLRKIKD